KLSDEERDYEKKRIVVNRHGRSERKSKHRNAQNAIALLFGGLPSDETASGEEQDQRIGPCFESVLISHRARQCKRRDESIKRRRAARNCVIQNECCRPERNDCTQPHRKIRWTEKKVREMDRDIKAERLAVGSQKENIPNSPQSRERRHEKRVN